METVLILYRFGLPSGHQSKFPMCLDYSLHSSSGFFHNLKLCQPIGRKYWKYHTNVS
jgi:hypothetical protein